MKRGQEPLARRFECVYCAQRFATLGELVEHRGECGPPMPEEPT